MVVNWRQVSKHSVVGSRNEEENLVVVVGEREGERERGREEKVKLRDILQLNIPSPLSSKGRIWDDWLFRCRPMKI